jgi:parallel beta-helix repeat protein
MMKPIRSASQHRINTAVCGGVAILLSACGAGEAGPAASASAPAPQIAAVTYNGTLASADIFVAPTGSDSAAGTQAAPFRTIARAAQAATPGVTVRVLPGTYTGGFKTTVSGTAEAPIRFVSEVRRGAKIVPPATSASNTAWDNRGSHVDIDGFEVNGSNVQAGTKWLTGIYTGGSYSNIKNNYVHHIARTAACSGSGGGIGSDSYYKGVANNVSGNVVHDVGPAACALFLGIYINTAHSRVENNLVYGISHAGIRLWHDASNVIVVNNTVLNSHTGVLVGGDGGYISVAPNDYTRVSNNLLYDNKQYGIQESGSTGSHNVYANNLIFRSGSYATLLNNGLQASATVAAEPQLLNYIAAGGGDYRPARTSPAIGKGLAQDAPPFDLDGKPRNSSTGIDIGAYQHLASTTPPPPPPPEPTPDPLPLTTYNFYVAPTGSDTNPGTKSAPFKTIARAARAVLPNSTVHVAPGTYAGGFKTTVSGSASARIYFVSTTKWGARIVPPASSSNSTAWDNRGSYVDIIGFQIDGTSSQAGTKWLHGIYNGGSYDVIKGNWVHHIASNVPCTSAGGSAIGVDSYYHGVKSDVIGNLVHDIGPAGCRFIQGIYISTSGTVKNNVVYRVAEGAIHLWHDATNVIITNNTVTSSHTGIIVGGGDFYHTTGGNNNTIVANNIVYDNAMGISEQGQTGSGNRYTNNLVYQNPTYNYQLRNGLVATASVTAVPGFVGYSRTGTPNLHLSATSAAIGKGTASNAPAFDFDGKPRNATTGFDIGAYQH